MTKPILIGLAAYFSLLAAALLIFPWRFYINVPGVSDSGPFNSHFMRDVGLAFLVSAGALGVGAWKENRDLALFGAAYPVLHGGYHVLHWLDHDLPLSGTAVAEVMTTAGLAVFTLIMATTIKGEPT